MEYSRSCENHLKIWWWPAQHNVWENSTTLEKTDHSNMCVKYESWLINSRLNVYVCYWWKFALYSSNSCYLTHLRISLYNISDDTRITGYVSLLKKRSQCQIYIKSVHFLQLSHQSSTWCQPALRTGCPLPAVVSVAAHTLHRTNQTVSLNMEPWCTSINQTGWRQHTWYSFDFGKK